jgi:hypothetical protein
VSEEDKLKTNNEKVTINDYYYYYLLKCEDALNELEKWLEEQHQFIIEIPAFTKEISIEHKTMEICYENILNKIQKLKGDDK